MILEVSVRILKPQPVFENHTTSNFGLPTAFRPNIEVEKTFEGFPHQIKTDNKHLRSFQEHSYKKPDDTYRILCIGGSIFAASGVNNNETFAYFLDRELKKRFPEKKFEVINAGKNLWELAEFYTYFSNEGYKYEPDLTVVYFHSGEISTMDFSKIEFYDIKFKRLADHQIELSLHGLNFNQHLNTSSAIALNFLQNIPLYDTLFPTSHLLRFIENYFRNNLIRDKTLPNNNSKKNLEQSMETWNWNMNDTIHWKTDYGEIINSSFRQKEAALYSIALKKFANLLNTSKSKLLFLTIPSPKEILKLESYSNDFKPFPFGDKDNITWFDLLDTFTKMQYESLIPFNFPNVIHWTPAGHRLAAQLTLNTLIKEKLLPSIDDTSEVPPITMNQNLTHSISNANKRISKQLETKGYAYFVKGVVNINLNQLDLAEKFLKISLEKSFNVKETLWQLGRVYFFKRDFKNAATFIQRAIDKNLRTTDTVYTLLAKSFFNFKNISEAELNFQKAIDYYPSNYINHLNYGKMLFFQNRFSDALNAFERANVLFPKNVDTLLGIASSSLRVEKNKKALEAFKIILQIDPKNTPAQKGLEYLKTKKAR